MTIKHLFPPAFPKLDLNFAAERSLDPRITFTRSSIAGNTTAPTSLSIGQRATGDSKLCGTISRLSYYPRRLSDEQLQALTL